MEYKPIAKPYKYFDDFGCEFTGQDCDLCPFREIGKGEICRPLFQKEFGESCTTHCVIFVADING